jgi:hypothetical protein
MHYEARVVELLAHSVHWLLGQQMQSCLLGSTLHGNIDVPEFFPFFTLLVTLNCCTHCRLISQEAFYHDSL